MTTVKWISYGELDSLLCKSWDLFFIYFVFKDFIITIIAASHLSAPVKVGTLPKLSEHLCYLLWNSREIWVETGISMWYYYYYDGNVTMIHRFISYYFLLQLCLFKISPNKLRKYVVSETFWNEWGYENTVLSYWRENNGVISILPW